MPCGMGQRLAKGETYRDEMRSTGSGVVLRNTWYDGSYPRSRKSKRKSRGGPSLARLGSITLLFCLLYTRYLVTLPLRQLSIFILVQRFPPCDDYSSSFSHHMYAPAFAIYLLIDIAEHQSLQKCSPSRASHYRILAAPPCHRRSRATLVAGTRNKVRAVTLPSDQDQYARHNAPAATPFASFLNSVGRDT